MRVIAGKAKSIPLTAPKGMNTRPTTDRIKETLFNMLQPWISECSFLDLFAGSGAIGIEALSRGASGCTFVEKNRGAVSCIRENLRKTRLEDNAVVLQMDVMASLKYLEGKSVFSCVFMDPPYQDGAEREILTYLADSELIADDAVLIVEAALTTDFSWMEELPFEIIRDKRYKTNRHLFVQKKKKEQENTTYDNSSLSGHI
ncbi:MAG: 16S rRNA (guanine(966)-N(2))-methyltransferase RsmD [Ruminococcus sp.]|jgi:16S rRNA (guanine966-N2)-methyltransferase